MWNLDQNYMTSAGRVAAGSAGNGPALLLAHGWPWSSCAWSRIIPALAQDYTVHWYDMPGFGASELDPPQAPTLALQGRVMARMLAHLGLKAPSVIAHDFGGAVTLRAHLLHDVPLARMILINVVAMRPWASAFFDHVRRHAEAIAGLPQLEAPERPAAALRQAATAA